MIMGLCVLRHGIQDSMEAAFLACHPELSTDWAGWQFRVNYVDVFAQSPLNISTDLSKTMHPTMCDLKVSSNNQYRHRHTLIISD